MCRLLLTFINDDDFYQQKSTDKRKINIMAARIGTGQVSSFVLAQFSIFQVVSKGSESKI